MYEIKQQPQDFCVKELHDIKSKEEGEYCYFILQKKNHTTLDALQKIANALKIPIKNLGFAGSKDKRAITEQICSAKNISKQELGQVQILDISTVFFGRGDVPISLGDHCGNYFKIIVRNITKTPELKTKFINYFGEQRLSTNNAVIGKLIVQKNFKEATKYIIDNKEVAQYLQKHPTDHVGAIKKLQIKITRLYVHAYQSQLWNRLAEKNQNEQELPIIGFGTKETELVKEILQSEGITTRDFINRQIPQISSEGGTREVFALAKNLKISTLEDDELNFQMKKITLEFELGKGSYATEFIRQLFCEL